MDFICTHGINVMAQWWWMIMRKTVCVDFDGVLNNYEGFDGNNLYTAKPFVKEFLEKLDDEYDVMIFTTREKGQIQSWLYQYGLEEIPVGITNQKVPALAYIDDRAIQFRGNFNETLKELENFKAYWEEEEKPKEEKTRTENSLDAIHKYMKDEDYKNAVIQIESLERTLRNMKTEMIMEAYRTNNLCWESDYEPCMEAKDEFEEEWVD